MIKPAIVILIIVAIGALCFVFLRQKGGSSAGGKIVYDDPANVLFSMPTICDASPQVEANQRPGVNDFVMHEDNWRQIEFVPRQNLAALTNLIAEVIDFEKANREQYGWKNTFVRKEYAIPVSRLNLSFKGLLHSFNPEPDQKALFVTSGNFPARVRDGFCLRVKGAGTIYGQRNEDRILELAFEHDKANPTDRIGLSELHGYCDQNQLVMVDWYHRKVVNLDANGPPEK